LLLLEHEIDGLLKRKINYTSKDAAGTRFLDYTTILNDKENEIVTLSKKIENLETRLKERKSEENHLKAEIERLNTVITTLNNPQVTREDIDNLLLSQF
jgi:peptidoglycan hydrolase CwlO-like protein